MYSSKTHRKLTLAVFVATAFFVPASVLADLGASVQTGVAQPKKAIVRTDQATLRNLQAKTDELVGRGADYNSTLESEGRGVREKVQTPRLKKPNSTAKSVALKKTASERKKILVDIAKKDPRRFLQQKMDKTKRANLPKLVQQEIEEDVTLRAKIEVYHLDNFKDPTQSDYLYFLHEGKERLQFFPTETLSVSSGSQLRIKGVR